MNIQDIMLKRETLYSKYASFDKDSIRLEPIIPDIRPNYFRDIDRIIHTSSYTRYMNKTQVFSLVHNDNISKRMVHVQLVSKIARTIGRALSLNEDLIEAIALGHDLGHCPFGHEGERLLNKLSIEHNEGYFMHNVQSVRILKELEHCGKGTNVSIQVLDGILCHNGEFELKEYYPKKKSLEDFLNDYEKASIDKEYADSLVPMTLEGCVVRISDMIAYLGRDIEDATKLKMFTKDLIPKSITDVLGNTNSTIIDNIINDIINNSIDKPYLRLSDEVFEAISSLKKFNYQNIYEKAHTQEDLDMYEEMFKILFNACLEDLNKQKKDSDIHKYYINIMSKNYLDNTANPRKVIDYISSMTDDFFIKEYNIAKENII